ncbi:MAG: class I SAM-dependent methyltransferase [Betaproteobacteria bacterium]|nr:class I SAM-dependent methyltransferase [Betaproteobacteria bacterium]MDE2056852.1 class I SAM-dependent methyltransferase [Betaproteobacteria bacterium]
MQKDPRKDFNKESINWDNDNAKVHMANAIAQAMIDSGRVNKSQSALDFGCGTGLVTLAILPHVKSIVGVDSSTGMLERLDEKIKTNQLTNISTQFVDFEQGTPIEGCFDLIISSMTAHHIPDTLELLKEWHRALGPQGQICFADLDSEDGSFHSDNTGVFHYGFDRNMLKTYCEQAGFVNITDRTATTIIKEVDGQEKSFPIFLVCATKAV